MIQPQTLLKDRYRVGRRLGEGGMAIVYTGHDLLLGRDIAVKTLRPQFAADPSLRARFAREAQAAASLAHPNIIDVHDVGEEDGIPFIVMELVRGQSLKAIIAAEAPFHPDDVAALLTQVAAALDYAHTRGYVHRDVKPGNILLDEHSRVRVVDFGIAKGIADTDLTADGGGFGTAAYLSPEQAAGLMATPASDVYSLGVVAFELLTGRLPFTAETPVGLAMRHVNDAPPLPSHFMPGIPAGVDAVILRALAKEPTRRWSSAGAFARALRDWRDTLPAASETITADPVTAVPPAGRAPTLVVIVLVLAALAALLWLGFRPDSPAEPAETPPASLAPRLPAITSGLEEATIPPPPQIQPSDNAAPDIAPETPLPVPVLAPTIAPVSAAAIAVPNVQGLTISGATAAFLPRGLRIAQSQPVFSDTIPLNAIASQDPPPGVAATAGQIVRVSLSRGPSPFLESGEP